MSDLSIQVAVADDHPVVLLGVAMELGAIRRCASSGRQTIPPNWSPCWTSTPATCRCSTTTCPAAGMAMAWCCCLICGVATASCGWCCTPWWTIRAVAGDRQAGHVGRGQQVRLADASGRRGACRAWRPAVLLADHQDMLLNSMMVAEPNRLTPREAEIVRLFCAGSTITEIAERLHRSADRQYPEAQRHAQAGREPRRGLDQDVHRRSLSSAAGALFTGAARSRRVSWRPSLASLESASIPA